MTQARLLARGEDDDTAQTQSLLTIETALAKYKVDLMARDAAVFNADRPLYHLGTGAVAQAVRAGHRRRADAMAQRAGEKPALRGHRSTAS